MALNLSTAKFSTKDQATLHLRHPETDANLYDDLGNPVEIVLLGKSSLQYRNALKAMQNRSINRGKKKASAELYEQEALEMLVACSVEAHNLVLSDDRPIDSPAAFKELYSDPGLLWIKTQVEEFLEEISNFLPK